MAEDLKKIYFGVFIVFLVIAAVGLFFTIIDLNGRFSVGGKSRKFIADAADFNNPLTGNVAQETTKSYGYVEAPYYGKAQDASMNSFNDNTKSEVTQVYEINRGQARIKPVVERPSSVYDSSKPIIRDLEDLKKIICSGYNVEKPIQKIEPRYGEEKKEGQTVTYTYDKQGRLNTVEPMGAKSRRFAADAG